MTYSIHHSIGKAGARYGGTGENEVVLGLVLHSGQEGGARMEVSQVDLYTCIFPALFLSGGCVSRCGNKLWVETEHQATLQQVNIQDTTSHFAAFIKWGIYMYIVINDYCSPPGKQAPCTQL